MISWKCGKTVTGSKPNRDLACRGDVWRQGDTHQMMRLSDITLSVLLLGITLPLMFLAGLAIKWESPGPIFDRQPCIGHHGRRFQLLNFRVSEEDPAGARPAWARKMTRSGQFLRYTRIEHLPQLINVLRGEISLIDSDARSPSFLE